MKATETIIAREIDTGWIDADGGSQIIERHGRLGGDGGTGWVEGFGGLR